MTERADRLVIIRKSLIIILSLYCLLSCSDNRDFHSPTDWKVLYSQSENIDEVGNSDGWLDIEIDNPISLPYPEKKIFQYIWLKGRFTTLEEHKDLYGISIARLSMVDRVYLNGKLVGYLNEDELRSLDSPRSYPIPEGLMKKGENTVYIRAGVYDEWDVEFPKSVLIHDAETFRRMRNHFHLISEIIPISILTLIIGTFFSLLFKSANERWNREYLVLAFRLLIVILCYLTFYSPIPLFSIEVILAIWNMALPLLLITMVLLYQEVSKVRFEKINRIIIPFLGGSAAAAFVLTAIKASGFVVHMLIGLSVVTALAYIFYLFKPILRNRKRDFKLALILSDAFIISVNIMVVVLFLLFDIALLDPSLLSIASGLLLTILFAVYFARRDGFRKQRMESLLIKLNEIESKAVNSRMYNISPTLESKLGEITSFIKDNHSAQITREELAESVGVNPNYFSSLFNIYTGKKVNEYINDLRLEKASELLATQSDSIIDVAFSSGFESLATFNRLFKKKFNCTPRDYRKQQDNKK